MSEWKEYKLGELCESIDYGYTASAESEPVGPKFLRITDIVPQRISWQDVPYCTINEVEYKKNKLEKGDIVIARTGATTGYNYMFDDDVDTVFASYLIRYRINASKAYPKFINYTLKSSYWKSFVEGIIGGSAQPGANAKQFASFEILLPSLPEQKAIASVLSSLDDKIDLLHRQNKILEAMAETLFRQWFVEEAKDDWEEKPLSFFGEIICGKTPSKKVAKYFNGDIPFIKIPDMHGNTFIFDTVDKLSEEGKLSQENKTLPPKSICVSCIATVGLVSMNAIESQTNQQINSIIPYNDSYRYFLFLLMRSSSDLLHSMASGGTATLNLNTSNFSNIKTQYSGDEYLLNFHNVIQPIFDKIFSNQKQIIILSNTRDILLPKLMSGEVRVNFEEN